MTNNNWEFLGGRICEAVIQYLSQIRPIHNTNLKSNLAQFRAERRAKPSWPEDPQGESWMRFCRVGRVVLCILWDMGNKFQSHRETIEVDGKDMVWMWQPRHRLLHSFLRNRFRSTGILLTSCCQDSKHPFIEPSG